MTSPTEQISALWGSTSPLTPPRPKKETTTNYGRRTRPRLTRPAGVPARSQRQPKRELPREAEDPEESEEEELLLDTAGAGRTAQNPPQDASTASSEARIFDPNAGSRSKFLSLPDNEGEYATPADVQDLSEVEGELRGGYLRRSTTHRADGNNDHGTSSSTGQDLRRPPAQVVSGGGLAVAGKRVEIPSVEPDGEEAHADNKGADATYGPSGGDGADLGAHSYPRAHSRFHSLRPSRENYQADAVIMLLTLSIRPEANKLYTLFSKIQDLSATQLIGLRLRQERVKPSYLAEALKKAHKP